MRKCQLILKMVVCFGFKGCIKFLFVYFGLFKSEAGTACICRPQLPIESYDCGPQMHAVPASDLTHVFFEKCFILWTKSIV